MAWGEEKEEEREIKTIILLLSSTALHGALMWTYGKP